MWSYRQGLQYILLEVFLNIINISNMQQKYVKLCKGLGIYKS